MFLVSPLKSRGALTLPVFLRVIAWLAMSLLLEEEEGESGGGDGGRSNSKEGIARLVGLGGAGVWKSEFSSSSEGSRGGVTEGAAVVETRGEVGGPIRGRELELGSRGDAAAEVG